jgi:hypothetical protein
MERVKGLTRGFAPRGKCELTVNKIEIDKPVVAIMGEDADPRKGPDLAPAIAVFFMDTELRMKDNLAPMFENNFIARLRICSISRTRI